MVYIYTMKKILFALILSVTILSTFSYADEKQVPANEDVKSFITQIFNDNSRHISLLSRKHYINYAEQQTPRATVISCSDSRVQTSAFHRNPINDLFFIRNIGNQIATTEGSVEYGIYHLKTPVLLIIGHSNCGAIHAALGDYSGESKAIRHELDNLHLHKGTDTNAAVIENVHFQVKYALQKFQNKINNHELFVVGVVYDFSKDFDHGHGRLILVNLNGETDPIKIKAHPYIKNIADIAIGSNK